MTQYPGSLHHHDDFSNLRGRDAICTIDRSFDYALKLGHSVLAFTEHETVANAIKIQEAYAEVKKEHPDFKAILGNEIYLCRNGLNKDNFDPENDRYFHFILLAKNAEGHKQIRELSTRAWVRSYMAKGLRRVPTYYQDLIDIIAPNSGNIVASTACLGGFAPFQLLHYRDSGNSAHRDKLVRWLKSMVKLFGIGNFYLEMQPSCNEDQIYVNQELFKLSEELDIPYIITTDDHYINKDEKHIHKAYLRSQNIEREVDAFYDTTYMMDTEELENFFPYFTKEQMQKAYENIQHIADMCEDYDLKKPLKIPKLDWKEAHPKAADIKKYCKLIPNLQVFRGAPLDGDRLLADLIIERVAEDKTLQNPETYAEIDTELDDIKKSSEVNKAHWSYYLLNLQKILDTCWDAGTLVMCGRGSGVGFLLLYILGITQINPMREKSKTYHWRFLNPDRASVLDIDSDISGLRREQVLDKLREVYGQDRVANVLTLGTEKSKSAILSAARGLEIPVDTAQYIASLVPADRGMIRTLDQCYYGDPANDMRPIPQFKKAMDDNPELWEVAHRIENLVCRSGQHAGGVVFVDEPFTNSTALMRTPDGTIITQFELHDLEKVSLIKIDLLSIVAADKVQTCLELLADYGYIKKYPTLRETYENAIGVYNLEREDPKMWEMVWNHKIQALFQMEKDSGIQGIKLTKPKSVDDLATLNSVIRLMAQEKGAESPLEKYTRFKNDINEWYREMNEWGLSKEEQELLKEQLGISYGICESQERFMKLVQLPECGGFNLMWADSLRKSVAKKNPAAFKKLEKEYYERVKERGLSYKLCDYVWKECVGLSRGYGFNLSHTLAYSIIALQEMNLAYKYPTIFWDCANLIVDSGTAGGNVEKGADYAKISRAVNKIQTTTDVNLSLIDINQSQEMFTPNVEEKTIYFGLTGLQGVGVDIMKEIINNRPYTSFADFRQKVPSINKTAMVALIKSGAFDQFGERKDIMAEYIWSECSPKKKLTLQNYAALVEKNILPESLDFQRRVFVYNKALKKQCKHGADFVLKKNNFIRFYEKFFDIDLLEPEGEYLKISQKAWKKQYDKVMKVAKDYIAENQEELLKKFNDSLFAEMWNKYSRGNYSTWEMESLAMYYHEHELKHLDKDLYNVVEYRHLPEEPVPVYHFKKDGKEIPIYEPVRIAGTVIAKDDLHSSISVLTADSGVVNVKMTRDFFARINRRISEIAPDGTKTIVENGWTKKGTLCMLTGIRRGDTFMLKKYKKTPYHKFYCIDNINKDGSVDMRYMRYGEEGDEVDC